MAKRSPLVGTVAPSIELYYYEPNLATSSCLSTPYTPPLISSCLPLPPPPPTFFNHPLGTSS